MKFKAMEIVDIEARQKVMNFESEKEQVLYSERFKNKDSSNFEFVIGLPLEVGKFSKQELEQLCNKLRTSFLMFCNEEFAIAIHSKKNEPEVHFHISYNGVKLEEEEIKTEFLKYN